MKRSVLFVILAINFLEWLEFSLYLYLAKSVFAAEFFPATNHSLTLTFALFAAAYLARPIGGWLFGREADVNGRCKPMVVTAALMGGATLGICILPGYAVLGVTATWLLLIFRILQGVAIGGEVNTSAMFTIEHHPYNPLLAGALVAAFGALGMFMGSALAACLQAVSIQGLWRIVFALVGLTSLWVCRLRKRLVESPEFSKKQSLQLNELWRLYWRGLLNIAAVAAFVSLAVYLCNVYWVGFAAEQGISSGAHCAWVAAFAQLSSAMLAIVFARISKPSQAGFLLQMSMCVIAVTAPALFYFTQYKIISGIFFALLGYIVSNGLLCASFYYFLYQQLPSQYRCRGVSIIWALAASLGAIALPVTEALVSQYNWFWLPGLFVSSGTFLALLIIHYNSFSESATIKDVRIA